MSKFVQDYCVSLLLKDIFDNDNVSLENKGHVSLAFLQAWVKGCLLQSRQKLESFRDTYLRGSRIMKSWRLFEC